MRVGALAATVAIPLGVVARLSHWYPHMGWLMLSGYLAVAVVALAVVARGRRGFDAYRR